MGEPYSAEAINSAMTQEADAFKKDVYKRMWAYDPFMAVLFGDINDAERKALQEEQHKFNFLFASRARYENGEEDEELNRDYAAFKVREQAFFDRLKRERDAKKPIP